MASTSPVFSSSPFRFSPSTSSTQGSYFPSDSIDPSTTITLLSPLTPYLNEISDTEKCYKQELIHAGHLLIPNPEFSDFKVAGYLLPNLVCSAHDFFESITLALEKEDCLMGARKTNLAITGGVAVKITRCRWLASDFDVSAVVDVPFGQEKTFAEMVKYTFYLFFAKKMQEARVNQVDLLIALYNRDYPYSPVDISKQIYDYVRQLILQEKNIDFNESILSHPEWIVANHNGRNIYNFAAILLQYDASVHVFKSIYEALSLEFYRQSGQGNLDIVFKEFILEYLNIQMDEILDPTFSKVIGWMLKCFPFNMRLNRFKDHFTSVCRTSSSALDGRHVSFWGNHEWYEIEHEPCATKEAFEKAQKMCAKLIYDPILTDNFTNFSFRYILMQTRGAIDLSDRHFVKFGLEQFCKSFEYNSVKIQKKLIYDLNNHYNYSIATDAESKVFFATLGSLSEEIRHSRKNLGKVTCIFNWLHYLQMMESAPKKAFYNRNIIEAFLRDTRPGKPLQEYFQRIIDNPNEASHLLNLFYSHLFYAWIRGDSSIKCHVFSKDKKVSHDKISWSFSLIRSDRTYFVTIPSQSFASFALNCVEAFKVLKLEESSYFQDLELPIVSKNDFINFWTDSLFSNFHQLLPLSTPSEYARSLFLRQLHREHSYSEILKEDHRLKIEKYLFLERLYTLERDCEWGELAQKILGLLHCRKDKVAETLEPSFLTTFSGAFTEINLKNLKEDSELSLIFVKSIFEVIKKHLNSENFALVDKLIALCTTKKLFNPLHSYCAQLICYAIATKDPSLERTMTDLLRLKNLAAAEILQKELMELSHKIITQSMNDKPGRVRQVLNIVAESPFLKELEGPFFALLQNFVENNLNINSKEIEKLSFFKLIEKILNKIELNMPAKTELVLFHYGLFFLQSHYALALPIVKKSLTSHPDRVAQVIEPVCVYAGKIMPRFSEFIKVLEDWRDVSLFSKEIIVKCREIYKKGGDYRTFFINETAKNRIYVEIMDDFDRAYSNWIAASTKSSDECVQVRIEKALIFLNALKNRPGEQWKAKVIPIFDFLKNCFKVESKEVASISHEVIEKDLYEGLLWSIPKCSTSSLLSSIEEIVALPSFKRIYNEKQLEKLSHALLDSYSRIDKGLSSSLLEFQFKQFQELSFPEKEKALPNFCKGIELSLAGLNFTESPIIFRILKYFIQMPTIDESMKGSLGFRWNGEIYVSLSDVIQKLFLKWENSEMHQLEVKRLVEILLKSPNLSQLLLKENFLLNYQQWASSKNGMLNLFAIFESVNSASHLIENNSLARSIKDSSKEGSVPFELFMTYATLATKNGSTVCFSSIKSVMLSAKFSLDEAVKAFLLMIDYCSKLSLREKNSSKRLEYYNFLKTCWKGLKSSLFQLPIKEQVELCDKICTYLLKKSTLEMESLACKIFSSWHEQNKFCSVDSIILALAKPSKTPYSLQFVKNIQRVSRGCHLKMKEGAVVKLVEIIDNLSQSKETLAWQLSLQLISYLLYSSPHLEGERAWGWKHLLRKAFLQANHHLRAHMKNTDKMLSMNDYVKCNNLFLQIILLYEMFEMNSLGSETVVAFSISALLNYPLLCDKVIPLLTQTQKLLSPSAIDPECSYLLIQILRNYLIDAIGHNKSELYALPFINLDGFESRWLYGALFKVQDMIVLLVKMPPKLIEISSSDEIFSDPIYKRFLEMISAILSKKTSNHSVIELIFTMRLLLLRMTFYPVLIDELRCDLVDSMKVESEIVGWHKKLKAVFESKKSNLDEWSFCDSLIGSLNEKMTKNYQTHIASPVTNKLLIHPEWEVTCGGIGRDFLHPLLKLMARADTKVMIDLNLSSVHTKNNELLKLLLENQDTFNNFPDDPEQSKEIITDIVILVDTYRICCARAIADEAELLKILKTIDTLFKIWCHKNVASIIKYAPDVYAKRVEKVLNT